MSIINKMHQGLQENGDSSPILSAMPEKKHKQKLLLFCLITLLLASSLGLSYLIYTDDSKITASEEVSDSIDLSVAKPKSIDAVVAITPTPTVVPIKLENEVIMVTAKVAPIPTPIVKATPKPSPVPVAKVIEPKKAPVKARTKKEQPVPEKENKAYLSIQKSNLTPEELANIHLNNAQKALKKGDALLASQEKNKALNIKPDLHEVRKSLALYYYGVGEQNRATSVLKKGAIKYPEYADFNLMLSRIALKNNEKKKAFLYLNQSPPEVEGHLDYHVSYAILAQQFKNYELSEKLYQGLLTQRPNNGRWIMSLAIAQDKLGKESLAVESYQSALLQIDLSSKAKKYINQRLTYLANQ